MRSNLTISALSCLILAASSAAVLAQSAFNGNGAIILGYDSRTCNSTIEGALSYNSASNVITVCMHGFDCSQIGSICADGSIFAGNSPDGNIPMYTTPEDAGQFFWNNGNANGYVLTSTSDQYTGEANTSTLDGLDSDSNTAGVQPHQAAQYCADLNAHGHTDWYLPAFQELAVMYDNKTNIGNFGAGVYWASTERLFDSTMAYWILFFDGQGFSDEDKERSNFVRCVRKSAALPIGYSWQSWRVGE